MRNDSIEFGIASARRARRSTHGTQREGIVTKIASELPPGVVDEAFAGFDGPSADIALDAETDARREWQPVKQSLVASLAAQLVALDRQREQLAQLLRNIDKVSSAE